MRPGHGEIWIYKKSYRTKRVDENRLQSLYRGMEPVLSLFCQTYEKGPVDLFSEIRFIFL